MSFMRDLGSFISEVKDYKDDITSTFQGVSNEVKAVTDDNAKDETDPSDQTDTDVS